MRLPLTELVAPDWAQALAPVEPRLRAIGEALRAESAAGHRWLPGPDAVLRAFARPMAKRLPVGGKQPVRVGLRAPGGAPAKDPQFLAAALVRKVPPPRRRDPAGWST